MPDLHNVVRDIYATQVAKRHGTARDAFTQCVTYARQNRPEWTDEKARKAVARMIAEEPTG
jgi:hypothetical protein